MDMEGDLFSLTNLKDMEIIDVNTGTKLGFIKDLNIDCDEHRIISVVLPSQTSKISLFSKNEDIEVPWENIKKIGVDVILIDGEELADKV